MPFHPVTFTATSKGESLIKSFTCRQTGDRFAVVPEGLRFAIYQNERRMTTRETYDGSLQFVEQAARVSMIG